MRHASMILGAGMLAALATAATAETLTSRIVEWNPIDRMVTFENNNQMYLDRSVAPDGLRSGDQLTVLYDVDEDGFATITEITAHESSNTGEDLIQDPDAE